MTSELPYQPEGGKTNVDPVKIDLRRHFVKVLKEMEDTTVINIPKYFPKGGRKITEEELDALQWAKEFMERYERRTRKINRRVQEQT